MSAGDSYCHRLPKSGRLINCDFPFILCFYILSRYTVCVTHCVYQASSGFLLGPDMMSSAIEKTEYAIIAAIIMSIMM